MNELIESFKEKLSKTGAFFAAWASKFAYASTGATAAFAIDANTIGVVVSVAIGVLTYLTNHSSKKKQDLREQQEHDLRMQVLRRELESDDLTDRGAK